MNNKLTGAQQRVLDFYIDFGGFRQRYPSLRETCKGLGFSSTNSVRSHLSALEKKGRVITRRHEPAILVGYEFVLTKNGELDGS